ncbi:MAG: DUF2079 domain-containing protein [Candidatus Aureabacteria bacterium]|nr:DUF2079 domain-containing protein [Candidatus Auribacterota bacterium]
MKMSKGIPRIVLIILIVAYAVSFSAIAGYRYRSFSFHDIDLAVINQAFWNAIHGSIISSSPGECTVLNGGHVELIILGLAPLYAVFPGPMTLLILQSLALAIGAWPVFLIGNELVAPSVGLLCAFCYLVYPALNWVNLFEFHTISFSTPLLLWMFYFYLRRKWRLFCVFIFLCLVCREDIALPVFAVGVFALTKTLADYGREGRAGLKWGLTPLLAAPGWFILCIKFIQPCFIPVTLRTTEISKGGLAFYSWLGNSLSEIVTTVVSSPGVVWKGVMTAPKIQYLLHLYAPVSFMPLFSPGAMIMTLISLAEGLLSQRAPHFSIKYQYSSIITPMIFIASVYGIRNILRWKGMAKRGGSLCVIILFCALISAWSIGPLCGLPGQMGEWKYTQEDGVRQKMVDQIPAEVPVVATFEFAPKLSMRSVLFYFYHIYAGVRDSSYRVDASEAQKFSRYALVDFNDPLTFYDFYTPGGDRGVYKFLMEGNWQLAATVNSLALFTRGESPRLGVVRTGECREAGHALDRVPIPEMKLCGYTLATGAVMGEAVISLDVYCQRLKNVRDNFFIAARFVSRRDPAYSFEQVLFAPYRIYPSSRWKEGEVVVQSCNILVPREARRGEYDMMLVFGSEEEFIKTIVTEQRARFKGWPAYAGARDLVLP